MFSDMHEEWENRLVEKTKRETRQETAKEILTTIKERSQEKVYRTLFGAYTVYTIGSGVFDELAEKYKVKEVK